MTINQEIEYTGYKLYKETQDDVERIIEQIHYTDQLREDFFPPQNEGWRC